MRRIFTLLFIATVINVFGQNVNSNCGFNAVMNKLDNKHPHLKTKRAETEARIRNVDRKNHLRKAGVTSSSDGIYTGKIYEIPIVVHVIESNDSKNKDLKLSDQEIIDWVDRANKMFATTYGNGFYKEGPGVDGGAVMPFKLVLAKRSPSCMPTNGIVRYNGSTLDGYDDHGVNYDNEDGAFDYDIKAELAPHWPESSYFNIYLITGFDDEHLLNYGLMGYATFPDTYDYYYESWMKVATVKNTHDTTLTHELGHAFGLYHTFDEIEYDDQNSCPVNNDCTQDGDRVCDTSPSRSMYGERVPSNSEIDPCTKVNYDGTQYNIMNYTNVERKFTPGQRERAVLMMLESRSSLLNSTAGQELSVVNETPYTMVASKCNPSGIATNYSYAGYGPYYVGFGTIKNLTGGYDSDDLEPAYYVDYGQSTCYRPAIFTDIKYNETSLLELYGVNLGEDLGNFRFKAWIDYNNNGTFEDSEIIMNNTGSIKSGYASGFEASVTPPTTAVRNTYLRMRVAVDGKTSSSSMADFTACAKLNNGQMEDYAVRIVDESTASVSDVNKNSNVKLTYLKASNSIKFSEIGNSSIGNFEIFDYTGKVIQKGNSSTDEIKLNGNLPKGIYIVNFTFKGNKETKKFINQ